ncbi:MAG: Thymidylate kin protein [Patescibacteria group bacterium]|nr:Thymidylate kin protein [Patescibacteria group bacterium]
MKLITISGLDGSGKSTQIKLLQDYLEQKGSRVFYFHAIQFGLAKKITDFRNKYCLICKLLGKCKVYQEKSVTRANAWQIFLRKLFLRIDIWRFKLLRNQLRNKNYDYILSDRYFHDSVVNIEYLCHPRENGDPVSGLKFFTLDSRLRGNDIEKPGLAIYIQTSPETIMRRERVPDQGLEYLKKKKELYDAKIDEWGLKVVDGSRDKNVIFEDIKNLIKKVGSGL